MTAFVVNSWRDDFNCWYMFVLIFSSTEKFRWEGTVVLSQIFHIWH